MKRINLKNKEIRNKIIYVTLFLILLLTFFLGIYKITSESLWEDELYTLEDAKRGVSELISGKVYFLQLPAYPLFMHLWIHVFGISELALRFPSVIFGVLAVIVMFLFGKELYNDVTGLFGAFFLGISQFFVYYMQEARPYALLVLVVLLSNYLFIKFLKEKNNNVGLLYGFSILIGLYTHYFMAFVILFQNLFFIANYKKYKVLIKKWFFIQCIVFILFSVWFLRFVLPEMISGYSSFGWKRPHLVTVELLFNTLVGNFNIVYVGAIFTIIVLFSFIFNLFDKKLKKFLFSEEDLFLLLYLFMPLITVFIVSQFKSIWMPRYLIIIFPAFILIITRTLLTFRLLILQIGFFIILLMGNIFATNEMYVQPNKADMRGIASYINNNSQKNDLIICYRFPTFHLEYYVGNNTSADLTYLGSIDSKEYPSKLDRKISNRTTFFIVYLNYRINTKETINYLEPKVIELDQSFKIIEKINFTNLRIEKYERSYIKDKIENDVIQLPSKAFAISDKIENDIINFSHSNATAKIKFKVPENNYTLIFEVMGTPPAPVKFDILMNNQSYPLILNDSLSTWNSTSINIGWISNETNNLQFIFREDAYSKWKNGTVKYDRNGYIKNISLKIKKI